MDSLIDVLHALNQQSTIAGMIATTALILAILSLQLHWRNRNRSHAENDQ